MSTYQPAISKNVFPNKAIARQLEKIFIDPHFADSEILKRFLTFIIEEMLAGRSNQLKEYTIAVNVLDKPVDFNPKENGIVRIHAGRLRRALHHYYSGSGMTDEILVSIPKGNYIPMISNRASESSAVITDDEELSGRQKTDESVVVAVLPFLCLNNHASLQMFTEGLCLHLTEALMHMKKVTVISFQAVKSLCENIHDVREVATILRAEYLISGSIQFHKGDLRANIQMMNSGSCKQVWSKLYEGKLSQANVFDVEDEITGQVCNELQVVPQFNPKPEPVAMRMAAG
ncbi:hypothetical protein [Flavihumibacter solisilvae]|uniref:Uncharacterized protein n=1 Tax=Flavihumibacter solisilvae TaxID=1349421 RepID=A0A0C1LC18_9BACT|nr:hypothetical protein [Flavihumibacter solisilvae]KIC93043.1 hypothetical protein OI18_20070 [Flavihumibacter solisilvae]